MLNFYPFPFDGTLRYSLYFTPCITTILPTIRVIELKHQEAKRPKELNLAERQQNFYFDKNENCQHKCFHLVSSDCVQTKEVKVAN